MIDAARRLHPLEHAGLLQLLRRAAGAVPELRRHKPRSTISISAAEAITPISPLASTAGQREIHIATPQKKKMVRTELIWERGLRSSSVAGHLHPLERSKQQNQHHPSPAGARKLQRQDSPRHHANRHMGQDSSDELETKPTPTIYRGGTTTYTIRTPASRAAGAREGEGRRRRPEVDSQDEASERIRFPPVLSRLTSPC